MQKLMVLQFKKNNHLVFYEAFMIFKLRNRKAKINERRKRKNVYDAS